MSELPDRWALVTLQELAGPKGLMDDGDWIESKDQDPDGDVRLIQLADIGDGHFVDKSRRFLTSVKANALRCTHLQPGDLLIARMPDPLGRSCILPDVGMPSVTAVDVCIWRPAPDTVDARWLMHFINSPEIRDAIQSQASGTTRQRVSGGNLKRLPVPVPPAQEQRRIVAKLDSLRARSSRARNELDHIPKLIERYKQAVLRSALSGDLTAASDERMWAQADVEYDLTICAPASWKLKTIEEVCNIVGGSQPPKSTFANQCKPGYVRLIQIRDYKSDKHLTYIPKELARRYCNKEDIMIGRYGPPIFQILRGLDGAYNVALMKAEPNTDLVHREFLYWLLQSPDLFTYVEVDSKRTAGQDGVNKSHLLKFPVFVPDKVEQLKIVAKIEQALSWLDRIKLEHARAEHLLPKLDQAILAKAFRGELVPQDPNDEPASVLLERIKAERSTANGERRRGRRTQG